MDIHLIVTAAGSICYLVLGIYALAQAPGKTLNRLFFLISISLAGLFFEENRMFTAETLDLLLGRYKVCTFFYAACFALNLHFYLVFTGRKLKPWQAGLIYLPALFIIINAFIGQSMFAGYRHNGSSWEFIPAYGSYGLSCCFVFLALYILLSIIVMERYRRRTDLNKGKRQAVIIISAYSATMTFAITSILILPAFGIYGFARTSPYYYLIYFFALFYAVFRLKFLKISPAIMADEIIGHIGEMILLLGSDGRLLMGNRRTLETLETGPEDLKQKYFFDIIRDKDAVHERIDTYFKGEEKSLFIRINYVHTEREVLTETYLSRIYDKFGDPSGFLVISKENKGKRQVQKAYKITDREFEVVECLLSGLSNKEIGEQLGISVRTVEAHCLHIYNKIGIKDRIELFTFANEFNLLPKKQ
jgi:DNA-binding CsgD family transcriptional regulator